MKNSEDILKKLSEPIPIEQVEFRVQSVNKGGYATIVPYKDARVDMNRLDDVCGALWQDKYQMIDNQLFCSIGIKIDGEWIWREDVGTESNVEKAKGRASDAFKRSGFRFGIGRELYYYPLIIAKLLPNEFKVEGSKAKQTWNLKIKEWKWSVEYIKSETGPVQIKKLTAKDQNNKERYDSTKKVVPSNTTPPVSPAVNGNGAVAKAAPKPAAALEKKWLNKMDFSKKNFTKEWLNVVNAINACKITSLEQVKKHYKVNADVADEINLIINFQPQNS